MIWDKDILRVEFGEEILARLPDHVLNKIKTPLHSFRQGAGIKAGLLGQFVVEEMLTGCRPEENLDYDLIYRDLKIDVKTNEQFSPVVLSSYVAQIEINTLLQKCDVYVITRVAVERQICWVVGWVYKSDLEKKAVLTYKGEKSKFSPLKMKQTCLEIPFWRLTPIRELIGNS